MATPHGGTGRVSPSKTPRSKRALPTLPPVAKESLRQPKVTFSDETVETSIGGTRTLGKIKQDVILHFDKPVTLKSSNSGGAASSADSDTKKGQSTTLSLKANNSTGKENKKASFGAAKNAGDKSSPDSDSSTGNDSSKPIKTKNFKSQTVSSGNKSKTSPKKSFKNSNSLNSSNLTPKLNFKSVIEEDDGDHELKDLKHDDRLQNKSRQAESDSGNGSDNNEIQTNIKSEESTIEKTGVLSTPRLKPNLG